MIRPRSADRAPGAARVAGLLTLVAGIVLMHIGLFGCSHHGSAMDAGAGADAHMSTTASTQMNEGHTHRSEIAASADHATMVHACVFILVGVAFLVMLTLVMRLGITRPLSSSPGVRWLARRRNRAPPWTVPSLAELAILRI